MQLKFHGWEKFVKENLLEVNAVDESVFKDTLKGYFW